MSYPHTSFTDRSPLRAVYKHNAPLPRTDSHRSQSKCFVFILSRFKLSDAALLQPDLRDLARRVNRAYLGATAVEVYRVVCHRENDHLHFVYI